MTTITLDPQPSGTPAPFVDVLAESFPGGTATVTVWRIVAGRQFRVRGLVNLSAAGTVSTRDFEAPFDIEIAYRVEHFDAFGNFTSWSTTSTTTLTGEAGKAWFHNPLDPATSLPVIMMSPAAAAISRPVDAEILQIQGRSLGVTMFGARRGVTGVVLDCKVATYDEADKFDALFGVYDDDTTVPIICIRTERAMRLPPTLFALIASPQQIPFDPDLQGEVTRWLLTGDEVAPPPEAIITVLLGYDDFTAFYADYAAFTAAYVDYREAQRDYTIAGTA